MPVDPHALGQRIATLRRAHGLSQRRLAEAAGVSHGYIALLELGRLPSPGKFRLDAVARALNLRTSDALLAPVPELSPRAGLGASGEPDTEIDLDEALRPPPGAPTPAVVRPATDRPEIAAVGGREARGR